MGFIAHSCFRQSDSAGHWKEPVHNLATLEETDTSCWARPQDKANAHTHFFPK